MPASTPQSRALGVLSDPAQYPDHQRALNAWELDGQAVEIAHLHEYIYGLA